VSAIVHRFQAIDRRRRWLFLVPVALVVLFFAGYWPRHAAKRRLVRQASVVQNALPRVKVVTTVAAGGGRSLVLPGTLVANEQALVNARATGYVRRYLVDIGDRVKVGDVLAELDTPELDQALVQARSTLMLKKAALDQALANLDYARVTATREDALLAESLSSKQTNDQAHAQVRVWDANVAAAKADVDASDAYVRELAQLVSFGRVVAPFDGRITQRNIDIGSLVSAGAASATTGGQPLFRIEANDPIRVFLQIPQAFALSVKDGQAASVVIRQLPGRTFEGHVTRTAGTIDPTSRTLNVQINVPNSKGELVPGTFADVTIAVDVAHRIVRVPSGAVITDARGNHVATVDGNGQVHLVAVVRGLDNGNEIDLIDGLDGGEQVIATPGGDVTDGMRVEPVTAPPAAPSQTGDAGS
jgi:RND family efflux transporter MFP subunit